MQAIPEIAADSGNTRQMGGKITESDRLDEIVKPAEHGENLRQRSLFACHGDHQKNCSPRQRRVDALRVDRHPVPTLARHPEFSACSANLLTMTANRNLEAG